MALREGAALGILAGQPHPMAFEQQRAEGQRLAGRPVDAGAGVDRLARGCRGSGCSVRCRWKPGGSVGDLLADRLQRGELDAGLAAARIVGRRPRP